MSRQLPAKRPELQIDIDEAGRGQGLAGPGANGDRCELQFILGGSSHLVCRLYPQLV